MCSYRTKEILVLLFQLNFQYQDISFPGHPLLLGFCKANCTGELSRMQKKPAAKTAHWEESFKRRSERGWIKTRTETACVEPGPGSTALPKAKELPSISCRRVSLRFHSLLARERSMLEAKAARWQGWRRLAEPPQPPHRCLRARPGRARRRRFWCHSYRSWRDAMTGFNT